MPESTGKTNRTIRLLPGGSVIVLNWATLPISGESILMDNPELTF